jgi:5-methyltetrahydrofolate--homocysteine methyltransferase
VIDLNKIADDLVAMDEERVMRQIQDALDQGFSAQRILDGGLIRGMDIVGDRMEKNEMFIPEVLMCAKIMANAVETLKPLLGADQEVSAAGKVVIGTVKGDLHDIGKNLVSLMLESVGFEVNDMGVSTPPEGFVAAIKEKSPNLLGLSSLLTTTIGMMKETIDAITESGLRDQVKIMVGGAPVTKEFADRIGADGYAADAGSAAKLAKVLLQQTKGRNGGR